MRATGIGAPLRRIEDPPLLRGGGCYVADVNVAGALSVSDTDEVMLLTAKGQSIRTRVK